MPYRLTKIYTRKGDDGYTTMGKKRVPKDDLLVETLGTLDELNCVIGLIVAFKIKDENIEDSLTHIQNELFNLGGELYLPEQMVMTAEKVSALEKTLDAWNKTLPPLKEFLLPRGNPKSAACHLARAICRRTERCLVKLHQSQPLHNPEILRYLNRLSDVLFVAARMLGRETEDEERLWEHERKR